MLYTLGSKWCFFLTSATQICYEGFLEDSEVRKAAGTQELSIGFLRDGLQVLPKSIVTCAITLSTSKVFPAFARLGNLTLYSENGSKLTPSIRDQYRYYL